MSGVVLPFGRPAAPEAVTSPDQPHVRFTVQQWREGRQGLRWAIMHQKPPIDLGEGVMFVSPHIPVLIASRQLDGQESTLRKMAAILNANWGKSA